MYTATGWLNVFLGIVNICLFFPVFFKEKKITAKEAMILQNADSGILSSMFYSADSSKVKVVYLIKYA